VIYEEKKNLTQSGNQLIDDAFEDVFNFSIITIDIIKSS